MDMAAILAVLNNHIPHHSLSGSMGIASDILALSDQGKYVPPAVAVSEPELVARATLWARQEFTEWDVRDRKIQSIKNLRGCYPLSLREAKGIVDALIQDYTANGYYDEECD